jgi:thiamine-monophosphate kinase
LKLAEVGEFGLIERIRRMFDEPSPSVILGIGDDAAVCRSQPGRVMLLTTDALVEGAHFHRQYTPAKSLGWKALAINISDIAAMGGVPRYALVTLALPETWTVEEVESLYEGIDQCALAYGCPLVGGDTVQSPDGCMLSVTVLGDADERKVVTRSGAREGDLICMTGEMGGARVGLEVLESGTDKKRFRHSVDRFLEPKPRLWEAKRLVEGMSVTSMIDISDGLTSEIGHLCRQSGLGCLIQEEKIPVSREAVRWAESRGEALTPYVLESGEEYELLFTVSKRQFEAWQDKGLDRNLELTVVGVMMAKNRGMLVQRRGKTYPLSMKGWDHFDR